jgi:hypothetical protein
MFGIDDPSIFLAYILAFGCLIFSIWYGITKWNEKDEDENSNPKTKKK